MNKIPSKFICSKIHAKKRALQRYKVVLNTKELMGLADKIQKNEGTFIKKQSTARTIWEVEHNNKKMLAVYDKKRAVIVTFLPEGVKRKIA